MSEINAVRPKVLQNFKVNLISGISQQIWDISGNASRLDIYESLYSPVLSAELTIMDDSNLISEIPILGQEIVQIYWQYRDKEIYKDFHVSEILDAKQLGENYGAYRIKLVTHKQYLNSINLFSRSYSGRNTEIISNIHQDYLVQPVEVLSEGGSSHNVVFPYLKPYEAINNILYTTFAADRTPLFLYETVNSEEVKLQSFGDMMSAENALIYRNQNTTHSNELGQGIRDLPSVGPTVSDQVLKNAYPTFRNISDGYFASDTTTIDISGKTIREQAYNYRDNLTEFNENHNQYFSDQYKLDEQTFDQMNRSNNLVYINNSQAFNSSVGNLYQLDSIQRATSRAYLNTMDNSVVLFNADPNTDLEVGLLADLHFKRMKPNLDSNNDYDNINSGVYLITAIKHTLKDKKYTLTCEAMRSGINYEVKLT